MTDTPIAVEIDCATGTVTERPLTPDEIAEREQQAAAYAAEQAAAEAAAAEKTAAREALLARLGMTAEEAALLLS